MRRLPPLAFTYPDDSHVRRHGPSGYTDVRSFRPWLRDEFVFRCAYCLVREQWGRCIGEFDLEHFVPVASDPTGQLDYDRFVYACHTCNLRKGDRTLADPSQTLTQSTVRIYLDGRVTGLTDDAARMIAVLCMNSPKWLRWRLTWIRIVELCQLHDPSLFATLMSYPEDLPDLTTLKAPANSRPVGVETSHYVRRERGELPTGYLC